MLNSFNVLDQLELEVAFTSNPYGLQMNDLFEVGARVNPKRSFLFVSKLIGKHLDVHPDVPKATGYLLADLLLQRTEGRSMGNTEPLIAFIKGEAPSTAISDAFRERATLQNHTLFIGFAETATGLGHAVFSAFNHASFVHTTREDIKSLPSIFDFKEEHSHAVDHSCFLKDMNLIESAEHIALVDDEMTSGKTSLNLIRSLHGVFPKKRYTILCLLDWRNEEQEEAYHSLEKELDISIEVVSLTKGTMRVKNEVFFSYEEPEAKKKSIDYRQVITPNKPREEVVMADNEYVSYLTFTGRFGLSSDDHEAVEAYAQETGEFLAPLRRGKKTLVLGMGEFMYLPSRISSYMGEGVTHKTSTRSPIYPSVHPHYPIHDRISYQDIDGITYYLYNLEKEPFDEIFLLSEKPIHYSVREEMASQLKASGVNHVTFVEL